MLNRFLDGVIHPLIHCGYGYELGIPGMIVEGKLFALLGKFVFEQSLGLAQAAVHPGESDAIIPLSAWKKSGRGNSNSTSSLLSVFSRILADPEIPPPKATNDADMYPEAIRQYSSHILKHMNAWSFDASNKEELLKAVEEIAWVVTIMYGVCGFTSNDVNAFNADFFT
jgi:hypothetical protein